MSDRLEELRHELADVEAALDGADAPAQADPLKARRFELEDEILALEREARGEAGVTAPEPEGEVVDVDVADFRPAPEELVVPSLPPGSQELTHATMAVLDKHDEDQVLSLLEERFDPVLMYDFNRSGTRVADLSIKGVLEATRLLNATGHARIKVLPETAAFDTEWRDVGHGREEFVVATIAAADEVSGLVVLGTSSEPILMRKRDGTTPFDIFARGKALSKAQRNALKGHIPERLRQAMLAMAKRDDQRVLEVKHGAGAAAAAQLPPPVATEAAKALEGECRALWLAIKGLPGWRDKMLPGQFNAKLSRARSSEVDLESFRDTLASLRDLLAGEAAA